MDYRHFSGSTFFNRMLESALYLIFERLEAQIKK